MGKKVNSSEVFYMNQFYDTNIQSTLRSAEAQVYGAYLRYSNGGKDKCWPGQDKLSTNLGLSLRTVGRAVEKLKEKGYIVLVRKGNNLAGNSVYVVYTPFQLGFTVKTVVEDKMTVEKIKALHNTHIVKANVEEPIRPYNAIEVSPSESVKHSLDSLILEVWQLGRQAKQYPWTLDIDFYSSKIKFYTRGTDEDKIELLLKEKVRLLKQLNTVAA